MVRMYASYLSLRNELQSDKREAAVKAQFEEFKKLTAATEERFPMTWKDRLVVTTEDTEDTEAGKAEKNNAELFSHPDIPADLKRKSGKEKGEGGNFKRVTSIEKSKPYFMRLQTAHSLLVSENGCLLILQGCLHLAKVD